MVAEDSRKHHTKSCVALHPRSDAEKAPKLSDTRTVEIAWTNKWQTPPCLLTILFKRILSLPYYSASSVLINQYSISLLTALQGGSRPVW